MIRKNNISAPEGYFDALQERLRLIPRQAGTRKTARASSVPSLLAPCLAYAASLVVAVLVGHLLLRPLAAPEPLEPDWDYVSYLVQALGPDGQEEMVDFLVDEGISVEP